MVGDPGRGRVDLRAGSGAPVGERVDGRKLRVDLRQIEEIKGIKGDVKNERGFSTVGRPSQAVGIGEVGTKDGQECPSYGRRRSV